MHVNRKWTVHLIKILFHNILFTSILFHRGFKVKEICLSMIIVLGAMVVCWVSFAISNYQPNAFPGLFHLRAMLSARLSFPSYPVYLKCSGFNYYDNQHVMIPYQQSPAYKRMHRYNSSHTHFQHLRIKSTTNMPENRKKTEWNYLVQIISSFQIWPNYF